MHGSKYGTLIHQARTAENQNAGTTEVMPDRQVNLSIKVPESARRHWVSEAKRQGTTLTAVIMESLTKTFGLPEN